VIGGYASNPKKAKNYFWMHTISDILNALIEAGLTIERVNEFDTLAWNHGNMTSLNNGLFYYKGLEKMIPLTLSVKARKH
jgi:hypothetical protein